MKRGRPLAELVLTVEENNRLVEFTRRRKSAQALALGARIVLACAQGTSNSEVADRFVADAHRSVLREIDRQAVSDLFRTPCECPASMLPSSVAAFLFRYHGAS